MPVSKIDRCRLCKNTELTTIFDLGVHSLSCKFPRTEGSSIFDTKIKNTEPTVLEAPLILVKCDNCQLLQLSHNVSGDEMYGNNYGYRSGLNNTMITHLTNLVREIEQRVTIEPNDIIADIGSNDCTLLKAYQQANLRRVGIDPTGPQFKQFYPADVKLIPEYFSKSAFDKYFDEQAKVVTSISMFYDLPDPIAVAQDIKKILHPKGIWVSEQSYAVTMVEKNSFDTICHEHLEYYTLQQFQYIADKVGFKIIDVSLNSCNGGSFRITLTHSDNDLPVNSVAISNLLQDQIDLPAFIARCETLKNEFMKFIRLEKSKGKSIYLYGASTKGNTLLQYYGLDNTIVTAAAERNPEKYGCKTPRTNIPIVPESYMRANKPDYLIVLPWHFKEEFLIREKEYMDNGGQIIFPLPNIEIYPKKN